MKTALITGVALAALTMTGVIAVNAQDTSTPKTGSAGSAVELKSSAQLGVDTYATAQSPTDWRSSKVIGLNVYNGKDEKIGDINDLIIGSNGAVTHAVVGVGGFLGLGEKNVAIPFTSVKMSRDKDGKPNAVVDSTKEALKAAPTYKYFSANS